MDIIAFVLINLYPTYQSLRMVCFSYCKCAALL